MENTEIVVSAGRTFNHPFESYSNLKPHITLKATIDDSEDVEEAVKELQRKAERMVEDHKNNLIRAINEIEDMNRSMQEIATIESSMKSNQERLDELRKRYPEVKGNLLTNKPEEEALF